MRICQMFQNPQPVLADVPFSKIFQEFHQLLTSDRWDKKSFFIVPDLVWIKERKEALSGIKFYVGDGATINRPMIRKKNARFSQIRSLAFNWCQFYFSRFQKSVQKKSHNGTGQYFSKLAILNGLLIHFGWPIDTSGIIFITK